MIKLHFAFLFNLQLMIMSNFMYERSLVNCVNNIALNNESVPISFPSPEGKKHDMQMSKFLKFNVQICWANIILLSLCNSRSISR